MNASTVTVFCEDHQVELTCGSLQVDEGILYVYARPENQQLIGVFNLTEWRYMLWQ